MIMGFYKLFGLAGETRYSAGRDPVGILVLKCEVSKKAVAGHRVDA
jgi:hypothetical protein